MKLPEPDEIEKLQKAVSKATDLTVGEGSTKIRIGGDMLVAIKQFLGALSSRRGSVLIGTQRDIELTSQQVADMLNVRRSYVIKLAHDGELPYRMAGNRYRFLLSVVQEYEGLRRVEHNEALAAVLVGYAVDDVKTDV